MKFFDSHAHYNDEKFDRDREEVLKQVYENNVKKLICAGYDISASKHAVEIAQAYDFIYATVGISPNDIPNLEKNAFEQNFEKSLKKIEELVKYKKVVAIGEIGLDYYWKQDNKEQQKYAFKRQIQLANKYNLPIVIHTRDAIYDTLEILKNVKVNKKGVFHCCPLNVDLIREGIKLGFYISFAGPVTFKNSKNAEETIKLVPLNKLLIETDSPYLTPEPYRGTRNNSINVKYIAQKIADIKQNTLEQIANITYENAKKVFEIE